MEIIYSNEKNVVEQLIKAIFKLPAEQTQNFMADYLSDFYT